MALVTYGPIVSNARKKIAGVVATKGHAGNFMRNKVAPIQPRTQSQRNVRSNFTSLAKSWGALTAAQIAGWNALAKSTPLKDRLGNSVTLTGLQMYMRLNRNLTTVNTAAISAPPATLTATAPGTLTVAVNHVGPTFTVTPTNYPANGESAAIFGSPQLSPGRTFIGKNYRLLLVVPYNASPTAYDLHTVYPAKFGTILAAKQIGVLVKHISTTTGAAGTPAAATAVVS